MKRGDDHVTIMQKLTAPKTVFQVAVLAVILISVCLVIVTAFGFQYALCLKEHAGWSLLRCIRR